MLQEHISASSQKLLKQNNLLSGLLQHVVTVPAGDGDECNSLGVVADLFDEGGGFLDNFVETVLAPLLMKSA